MKSIIVYYSQTGNTSKIAHAIRDGIIRKTGQCDLTRLKDLRPEDLVKYDLIGIGSPVWGAESTPNVMAFINKLPSSLKGKLSFFFCTHGTCPGHTMSTVVPALREKGLIVVGWGDWYGGVYLIGHPKPYFTDGHPDDIDVNEAETLGLEIAERSLKISQGATDLIPKLPEGQDYVELYGEDIHPQRGHRINGPLQINAEKCTGCMLCADNCPQNNIDSSVTPPVFRTVEECVPCYFCEGICPTGAIECTFAPITIPRVFQRNLHAAEEKGRFRRLVKEEDIGWDTPWEKASQHPRVKPI
jgi:flavodoxin/ferredoxin